MKQVLIINGHPDPKSFGQALAEKYQHGAIQSGTSVDVIHLHQLTFNPNLQYGYRKRTELEPDLIEAQQKIKAASHLVFIYPTWWGTLPALLKGFIDRVFLPGFAFENKPNSIFWDKKLKGKSARIITTMDTPKWYYRLFYRNTGHHAMKNAFLNFCGVKPVHITSFQIVKASNEKQRQKWLQKTEQLGQKDGAK